MAVTITGGATLTGGASIGAPQAPAVEGKWLIGARGNDTKGVVYVYDLDGTYSSAITASAGQANDDFGGRAQALAMTTSKILVGANRDDEQGADAGAVYLYDLDGSNELKITTSDGTATDNFGFSVALSATKIVAGARYAGSNYTGWTYIFDLDGTNEIKVNLSPGGQYDQFGESVAVNSSKFAVGANNADRVNNNSGPGKAFVYDLDGTNRFTISASDGVAQDSFGDIVVMNDSKICISASKRDSGGLDRVGAVYLYDTDGTNEIQILPPVANRTTNRHMGESLAMSDTKIAVGAPGNGANDTGYVFIYDLDGTHTATIQPTADAQSNMLFGETVSLAGDKVYVGAPYWDGTTYENEGLVYMYNLDGTGEVKLTPPVTPTANNFNLGLSVASVVTS